MSLGIFETKQYGTAIVSLATFTSYVVFPKHLDSLNLLQRSSTEAANGGVL